MILLNNYCLIMQEKSLFCWHWSFEELQFDCAREVVISLTVVILLTLKFWTMTPWLCKRTRYFADLAKSLSFCVEVGSFNLVKLSCDQCRTLLSIQCIIAFVYDWNCVCSLLSKTSVFKDIGTIITRITTIWKTHKDTHSVGVTGPNRHIDKRVTLEYSTYFYYQRI